MTMKTTTIDGDSLDELATDMALHARFTGHAHATKIREWVARLHKLAKRPEGMVPVMMEGSTVLAFGELKDGR